jgi:hypothetical protein
VFLYRSALVMHRLRSNWLRPCESQADGPRARIQGPLPLRVFGCLPVIGQSGCTAAGVRKASREETAGGVRTDAGVDLWGICRRCLI